LFSSNDLISVLCSHLFQIFLQIMFLDLEFKWNMEQGRAGFEHNFMSSDSFICPHTVFESAMCDTFLGCIMPMINSPGMGLV
jgi:hypothetical protein